MHLSLLSDGFVSDSYNDAGPIVLTRREATPCPTHFTALCRGLVVVIALAVPVGITCFAQAAPAETDHQDTTRSIASHTIQPRATNG
jgi:hypothetical protein